MPSTKVKWRHPKVTFCYMPFVHLFIKHILTVTGAGYTEAGDLFSVGQYFVRFVRVSLSGTLDWVPIDISTVDYSDNIVIDGNIQVKTRD